ncbi:MAG TPA: FkbM family methyltransferase [Pirellulales bacterium]|nr:FkbM family methyltransferase [Pirellulales bacterium]
MQWVKANAQFLLEKVVNRPRFNDSRLYHLYLRIQHRDHSRQKEAEKEFYRQALEAVDAKLVFDIGANGGSKTAIFSRLVERVLAVEPDPTAVRILKERFLNKPAVAIVDKGVGAEEGTLPFHIFEDADCYNTFSPSWAAALATGGAIGRPAKAVKAIVDIPVITLDRLIREHGVPSYIKIDVEGYEVHVVKGLTQQVPLLSFECNLPEFAAETTECLSILAKRCSTAEFNYCTTEPPAKFELDQWIPYETMSRIVEAGRNRFMEIYCRSL